VPQPPLTTSHLLQAIQTAQAGQFGKSLAAIRTAKALEPANVHILALEKQLIKLSEFTDVGALSKEERDDNFEVLRILADRAEEDLRDHLYSLDQLVMGPDFYRLPILSRGQQQATRSILIRQYLLRADQCLSRGDREGALLEIHRIYVIDPGNQEARKHEARIAAWRESPTADLSSAPAVQESKGPESSVLAAESRDHGLPRDKDIRLQRRKHRTAFLATRVVKKVLRAVAGLVILGSVIFLFLWRHRGDRDVMQESLGRQAAQGEETGRVNSDLLPGRPEVLKDLGDQEPTPIPRIPDPSARTTTGLFGEGAPASAQSEPRLTHLAAFNFPEGTHRGSIEAEVVVQVHISAEGKPIQADIISSSNAELNQAVAETIMRSTFSPGKREGTPVSAWVTLPLHFNNSWLSKK
jgi:TonB family protein